MKNIFTPQERIFAIILLSIGCGVQVGDKNSDNVLTSTIITGSYNTNETTCDFISTKKLDEEGNVLGCDFSQTCTGNVRTSDFIPFYDPEFNAKCINPVEELPILEPEEMTTPPSTIGSSF